MTELTELPVVVVTQSEGGGLTVRPHLALHHGVQTLRLLHPLPGLPGLPPLGRHVDDGQVGGGEEEESGGEESGVEEAQPDGLQVEAGDGEVGLQAGGPAGEGEARGAEVREERSALEVGRIGVLNNMKHDNCPARLLLQPDLRQGRVGVAAATDVGEEPGPAWGT